MDRDIEQAADLDLGHKSPFSLKTPKYDQDPAGRGDATQPDPAMIEQAIEAAAEFHTRCVNRQPCESCAQEIADMIHAAAAVIVPATAEHIAAAHQQRADELSAKAKDARLPREVDRLMMRSIEAERAAKTARAFAAGLSAGATGGGGDE